MKALQMLEIEANEHCYHSTSCANPQSHCRFAYSLRPHIASASKQTRELMAFMSAQNLIAGLKGERLPNCVNKAIY
jgi:lactate dehydrogenase-like 2-hydroxyacid dehydrogenase